MAVRVASMLLLVACKKDAQLEWLRFNGEDDVIDVEVAEVEPGPAVIADVTSSTGTSLIGDVRVEPGSGPPGTSHEVRVSLSQEFEDRVTRAEITVYAPNGGVFAYPMEQDSAEPWRWVLWVESTDAQELPQVESLEVDLYELIEPPDVEDDDNGGISIFDF